MSDISFSMTADEKDVSKALQNLINENAKLRGEITKGVNEAKSAAAQEREWQKLREKSAKDATAQMQGLNASAQRIKDSVATPFQNAQKETAVLREHLQAGRLTLDEYRAALARVAKELKEATRDHTAEAEAVRKAKAAEAEAAKQAAAAEREHTAAVKEATAVAAKYATREEQVAAEMKRLNELRAKGVLSSKDYARAMAAEEAKLKDSGQAAGGFGGMLQSMGGKMAASAAALVSITAVVKLLRDEYDALLERQGRSRDANLSLATEQEALLMNLGGADAQQVTKQIRDLSVKSGVKEENLTRAINEAMAARGDLGVDAVVKAVGTASKVRKFAPTELAGLAAATIDTQKQTGLGTDQSLGFLLQMQAASRTKSLKDLAQNFTPAVGGVMNFGADRQTAGAMLASLSHGMGDTSGAMSATAAIQLAKQLREYGRGGGPELDGKLAELDRTHAEQKAALTANFDKRGIALNATTMPAEKKAELRRQLAAEEKERKQALKEVQSAEVDRVSSSAPILPIGQVLARMQQDVAYREQFFKAKSEGGFGASFEAKAIPAIEGLLSGRGAVAGNFASARKSLGEDPTKALDAAVKARSMPAMDLAAIDQALANVSNQAALGDVRGAQSAIVRDRLKEMRSQLGNTAISQRASAVFDDLTTGGNQDLSTALQFLESERRDVAARPVNRGQAAPSFGVVSNDVNRPQTKEEQRLETLLTAQIEQLKQLVILTADQKHAGVVGARAAAQQEGAR